MSSEKFYNCGIFNDVNFHPQPQYLQDSFRLNFYVIYYYRLVE